jgi:serine/threonine protein kinase
MAGPDPHPADYPLCALRIGARVSEFEIKSLLGVGGFGIVYRALDHNLEREVALKEYMPATLASRTSTQHVSLLSSSHADTFALGLRSFVNEAKLLAKFDHPSLVKVYRFWEANGTAYMAMPLYHGRTAKQVRQAMGRAPDEAWLRSVVMPLLGALECLHAVDVFHRDIAPDNILIEPDGRPVLLDFGAARRVINDRSQMLTAILKPAYAPIEQYAETSGMRQGPWTDIYALGATLHFLLVGRPPAPAPARTVHDEARTLSSQSFPGVSLAFLAMIDWMLAPRPEERPQSIPELRKVLEGDGTLPARRLPPVSDDDDPDRTLPMPMDMVPGPGPGQDAAPTERLPTRYPQTLPLTRPLPRPEPAVTAAASRPAAPPVASPAPVVTRASPPAAPAPPPVVEPLAASRPALPTRAQVPPPDPGPAAAVAAPSTAGTSRALWLAALGVLVLAGLGLGAWWWSRGAPPAPPKLAASPDPVKPGPAVAPLAAAPSTTAPPVAPLSQAGPAGGSAQSASSPPGPSSVASAAPPTPLLPAPAVAATPRPPPAPSSSAARVDARTSRPPVATAKPPAVVVTPPQPPARDTTPATPSPSQTTPPPLAEPVRPAPAVASEPAKTVEHPLARCDRRSGVLRFVCLDLECAKTSNSRLPECVKLREEQEASRQPR